MKVQKLAYVSNFYKIGQFMVENVVVGCYDSFIITFDSKIYIEIGKMKFSKGLS